MQPRIALTALGLASVCCFTEQGLAQPRTRRTPPQLERQDDERSRRALRVRMEQVQVVSPDGKVRFTLLPNAERLTFEVALGADKILDPSPIVMKVDGFDLSSGVAFDRVERYEINESYPWYGAKSTAVDHCNGVKITLKHDLSAVSYTLEVRVFDDGVALRHVIPGDESSIRTPDEYSTFVVPAGATVWYAGMQSHYEAEYAKRDIAEIQPGEWAGPPVTFKLPGGTGYASISEADLVNYSGMALEADGRRGWVIGLGHRQPLSFPFELRYGTEEGKRLGHPASITGTISTPWRVVMVGRDLNALVNSTILPNLCPPPDATLFPDGIKTAWIKPGRAVWRYVDGGANDLAGMKEFARLGGQLGFEHHVIEGIWNRWSMEQRKDVADYSRQRGVGVWFWRHSQALRMPEAREEFFQMLNDVGAVGAKVDFFDHEAKEMVDLYDALLRKAAEHHVMLAFHGANKPTGRARTWPNEMVREAVRGMESSQLMERARHQTTLPFTRCLAGPADYTTMIFSARRRDSSWAHQIASMAVFSGPLLTIAAHPQSILANPAVDVIKGIPAVWDETMVLPDSEIGELAGFARRSGQTWYLALMCGPQAKTLQVPLSFLDAGSYKATLVRDNLENDAAVRVENTTQKKGDTLSIEMRSGGGFIARFSRK